MAFEDENVYHDPISGKQVIMPDFMIARESKDRVTMRMIREKLGDDWYHALRMLVCLSITGVHDGSYWNTDPKERYCTCTERGLLMGTWFDREGGVDELHREGGSEGTRQSGPRAGTEE